MKRLIIGGLVITVALSALIFGFLMGSGVVKFTVVPSLAPLVTPVPMVTKEALEIVGMVRYSELEGGCWYLETTDLKCLEERKCFPQFEPINLPEALKNVGMEAKFRLEVQSGTATTCQIGPAVKILDYQILR